MKLLTYDRFEFTGAVVAREYGLPCIVGAVNATRKLKFGDRVKLNASKGILYRVTDGE